jgi:hypothetical protein
MNTLAETAPAFVEMAHKIVWVSVATVDVQGRPRSRILHPIWQWDGEHLVGYIWLLQSQFFTRRERPTVNRRANQRSPAGFFRPVYRPLLLSPAL